MLRFSIVFAALITLSGAAPALAQQAPPPPSDSRPPGDLNRHMANIRHAQMAEFEAFYDQATGNNLSQPLERIDLANRVSTLIDLGRCDEARRMANEAGERVMALRARQLCRNRRSHTTQAD